MVSKQIEITITESFAKHKRNVLLVSAIIFILAASSSRYVKIPLVGAEQSVEVSLAYFFLLCTLAYFFLSYVVELQAVKARNSEGLADSSLSDVLERLKKSIIPFQHGLEGIETKIQQQILKIEEISVDIEGKAKGHMPELVKALENGLNTIHPFAQHGMDEERIATVYRKFDNLQTMVSNGATSQDAALTKISRQLEEVKQLHDFIYERSVSLDDRATEIVERFGTISRSINRAQRIGFGALETMVPVVLALSALVICIDGAFFHSTVTKVVRNVIPAISQTQSDAVPKVGTQSAETRQTP